MDNVLLEMRGVDKVFPGVRALAGVDFVARRGEVHALMGENGAGKSTLIKVLTGVYRRDAGRMLLAGRAIDPRSPMQAEALGISTVYQEVNLIPFLSVAENICLGRQSTTAGVIRWGAIRRRAREAMARLGLDIDVTRELASYSIAIQQMVAIARALDVSAKLLVLDEPTSSLDENEVQELFAVMRRLRDQGLGVIFITHFLDQAYEISDRITVLRNGEFVGEYRAADLPRLALIGKMIGKEPNEVARLGVVERPASTDEAQGPLIRLRGVGRRGAMAPMDLSIRPGEVVGLAGLLGSGRTETARMLFGIEPPDSGQYEMAGQTVHIRTPRHAIAQGIALTPEDRRDAGIIPNLSVRENIVLALQASRGAWRALSRREQNELAERFIKALNIKTPDAAKPVRDLSGGNQQKVLLARWLATEPRLLILDEPTRGIDVGAKGEIEKLIVQLRGEGKAILFISSELEEVVRDSQRVVVLRDRRKVGELAGEQITEAAVMHLIAQHEEGRE
jgi:simple sugar transport system ATP-binding protein